MKPTTRAALLLGAGLWHALTYAAALRAEVVVGDLHWQVAARSARPGSRPLFHDSQQWLLPPAGRAAGQVRAMVTLVNKSTRSEEALLVRFSISAKLAPVAKEAEGVWAVPFLLDERHIPRVRAGESKEVPIPLNRTVFAAHLKRKARTGLWPDALRIQLMVEPRSGEGTLEGRVAESTLKVLWKQPAAGGGK